MRYPPVDAQPVYAVAIQPEQSIGDEEIGNFRPSVIVDQRSPNRDGVPAAELAMLVESRPIELGEAVRIVRKNVPGTQSESEPTGRPCGMHRPTRKNRPACRSGSSARKGR